MPTWFGVLILSAIAALWWYADYRSRHWRAFEYNGRHRPETVKRVPTWWNPRPLEWRRRLAPTFWSTTTAVFA